MKTYESLQTQSINQHYTEDHQRLDDLFHEFTNLKASDRPAAEKSFDEFKAGLERHIVWEEEILFPAFDKKFAHLQGSPTAVMRSEHREIRKCLDAMARKLAEQNFDTDGEEARLIPALCVHNQKEEAILYPEIDRLFNGQERATMFSEMNILSTSCAPSVNS
jgi:iron-sulfur cluster repair protein YtfE (RIC family)